MGKRRPARRRPETWNRDYLHEAHVVQAKTVRQIAEEIDASQSVVMKGLRRYGIPVTYERCRTPRPAELGDLEWMREHYIARRMTAPAIAELIDATYDQVTHALHDLGIKASDRPALGPHERAPAVKRRIPSRPAPKPPPLRPVRDPDFGAQPMLDLSLRARERGVMSAWRARAAVA